ncbi:MAG: hypothetical protein M0Z85_09115, partial [Gammaproteobacteria bacterium]|nr:hypothetical protein [Gammaproteobacteria bacterium]
MDALQSFEKLRVTRRDFCWFPAANCLFCHSLVQGVERRLGCGGENHTGTVGMRQMRECRQCRYGQVLRQTL